MQYSKKKGQEILNNTKGRGLKNKTWDVEDESWKTRKITIPRAK